MASKDSEIRLAIKGFIKALYSDAQVYAWNALSHDLGQWPGMFGNPRHGWIIKNAAQRSTWKNPQRDRRVMEFDVWGFYGFDTGNETANSDNDFSEICEAIYEALKAVPTLNVAEVEKHELLQWVKNTTIDTGEETLHFAQGRLCVHLCC